MKWRNDSTGRFYDASESTVVYFDSRSGDTHLLSDFAAHLMQQFGEHALTTEELVNQISPTIALGDTSDLMQVVAGVLEELAALDILKRE
jgi:PqqD family protein of HPr-rel-A system